MWRRLLLAEPISRVIAAIFLRHYTVKRQLWREYLLSLVQKEELYFPFPTIFTMDFFNILPIGDTIIIIFMTKYKDPMHFITVISPK